MGDFVRWDELSSLAKELRPFQVRVIESVGASQGGNGKVILYSPNKPLRYFNTITLANAAAVSGDTIFATSSTYDEAIALTAGAILCGLGGNTKITQMLTFGVGSGIRDLSVVVSGTGLISGVSGPASGSAFARDCFIRAVSSDGEARAVSGGAGNLELWNCDLAADGATNSYSAYEGAGNVDVHGGRCTDPAYTPNGRVRFHAVQHTITSTEGMLEGDRVDWLRLGYILLFHPGSPARFWSPTSDNLASVLSAFVAGDLVSLPNGTITGGAWSMPSSLRMIGQGLGAVLNGPLNGPASGTAHIENITANVVIKAGNINAVGCVLDIDDMDVGILTAGFCQITSIERKRTFWDFLDGLQGWHDGGEGAIYKSSDHRLVLPGAGGYFWHVWARYDINNKIMASAGVSKLEFDMWHGYNVFVSFYVYYEDGSEEHLGPYTAGGEYLNQTLTLGYDKRIDYLLIDASALGSVSFDDIRLIDTTPDPGYLGGTVNVYACSGTFTGVIPLAGDRSAFDALDYAELHTNDTDDSATAIHHTLGPTIYQAAPGLHSAYHVKGGSDPIKLDDFADPDDNTDLDATSSHHGLLPKLSGDASLFLDGDGDWNLSGHVIQNDAEASFAQRRTLQLIGMDIVDDSPNNRTIASARSTGLLQWHIDGWLAVQDTIGASYVMPTAGAIGDVYAYVEGTGSAGDTLIDIHLNGVTIFTTQGNRPTIAFDDADKQAHGTPDVTEFEAGDVLTLDIDGVATGAYSLTVVINSNHIGIAGSLGNNTYADPNADRPALSKEGDLFLPTDVPVVQRYDGSIWQSWGPAYPLVEPPTAGWTFIDGAGAGVGGGEVGNGFIDAYCTNLAPPSRGVYGWVRSLPAAPYKITIALDMMISHTDYNSGGMIIREAASGKMIMVRQLYDGNCYVSQFSNQTTEVGNYFGPGYFRFDTSGGFLFFQIEDDGANRYYRMSKNGRRFATLFSHANTTYFVADQVGFAAYHFGRIADSIMLSYKEE